MAAIVAGSVCATSRAAVGQETCQAPLLRGPNVISCEASRAVNFALCFASLSRGRCVYVTWADNVVKFID